MTNKISIDDILEAHELDTENMKSYYNIAKEEMVVVSTEDLEFAKSNKNIDELEEWKKESVLQAIDFFYNRKNYLDFPSNEDYREESIIVKFINSLKEGSASKIKLDNSIKGGVSVKKFKDELYNIGLIDEWYAFREIEYKEIAKSWCIKNEIKYIE